MGKYLSPPTLEQVNNSDLKCAVIWYPSDDGLFFQQAVRGALNELTNRYMWEGESTIKQAIQQKFIEADLKTDGTFFVTDCELLDELMEDGEMAINVTVNQECGGGCCGGSGSGININIENNTGLELQDLPDVFPVDDGENPPDGWDTYEEYKADKCALATQMVNDFIDTFGKAQTVSGLVAIGAGFALTAATAAPFMNTLLVGLMAVGVGYGAGLIILTGALIAMIAWGSTTWDYWNDMFDYMQANKQSLICDIYESQSPHEANQIFHNYQVAALGSLGIGGTKWDTKILDVSNALFNAMLPFEFFIELFRKAETFIYGVADCSNCGVANPNNATFQFDVEACTEVLGADGYTWDYWGDLLIESGIDCDGNGQWGNIFASLGNTMDGIRFVNGTRHIEHSIQGDLGGHTLELTMVSGRFDPETVRLRWYNDLGNQMGVDQDETFQHGETRQFTYPAGAHRVRLETILNGVALVGINVAP